jgi:hypothetical protein
MFILAFTCFFSCTSKQEVSNPDFEKNLAIAKKFFELHESENLASQIELLDNDLKWQPAVYGSDPYGKAEHIELLKAYHNLTDNIKYTADNWLPGIDAKTLLTDGSVRTYGTWTAISAGNKKPLKLKSYHTLMFKDGKIVGGGDYFDATGMMASIQSKDTVSIK